MATKCYLDLVGLCHYSLCLVQGTLGWMALGLGVQVHQMAFVTWLESIQGVCLGALASFRPPCLGQIAVIAQAVVPRFVKLR